MWKHSFRLLCENVICEQGDGERWERYQQSENGRRSEGDPASLSACLSVQWLPWCWHRCTTKAAATYLLQQRVVGGDAGRWH